MLKCPTARQTELEMITLECLVPADHLLRKIDATIDFGFIRELTEILYCPDNGRPPIAPEVLFKALFIGYLFGICSERQLMREIEMNVAYRCPEGQALIYTTMDRQGYRHYKSDPVKCRNCPLLVSCTTNPKAPKSITVMSGRMLVSVQMRTA